MRTIKKPASADRCLLCGGTGHASVQHLTLSNIVRWSGRELRGLVGWGLIFSADGVSLASRFRRRGSAAIARQRLRASVPPAEARDAGGTQPPVRTAPTPPDPPGSVGGPSNRAVTRPPAHCSCECDVWDYAPVYLVHEDGRKDVGRIYIARCCDSVWPPLPETTTL